MHSFVVVNIFLSSEQCVLHVTKATTVTGPNHSQPVMSKF